MHKPDANMQTALDTLVEIVDETLTGVAGEDMVHMMVAIPRTPRKGIHLEKMILAGNMPPELAGHVLGFASEMIRDKKHESADLKVKLDAEDVPSYGKCAECEDKERCENKEFDPKDFMGKLEKFKTLIPLIMELRGLEGGLKFLTFFQENTGTPEGRTIITKHVLDAPETPLGTLKRRFLAQYLLQAIDASDIDIDSAVTH